MLISLFVPAGTRRRDGDGGPQPFFRPNGIIVANMLYHNFFPSNFSGSNFTGFFSAVVSWISVGHIRALPHAPQVAGQLGPLPDFLRTYHRWFHLQTNGLVSMRGDGPPLPPRPPPAALPGPTPATAPAPTPAPTPLAPRADRQPRKPARLEIFVSFVTCGWGPKSAHPTPQ